MQGEFSKNLISSLQEISFHNCNAVTNAQCNNDNVILLDHLLQIFFDCHIFIMYVHVLLHVSTYTIHGTVAPSNLCKSESLYSCILHTLCLHLIKMAPFFVVMLCPILFLDWSSHSLVLDTIHQNLLW